MQQTQDRPRALLDRKDLRELLGISEGGLQNLRKAKRGFPEPVRLGARTVRWRPEDIEAWLDANSRGAV